MSISTTQTFTSGTEIQAVQQLMAAYFQKKGIQGLFNPMDPSHQGYLDSCIRGIVMGVSQDIVKQNQSVNPNNYI